jgi:hypothetical protein
MNVTLRRVPVPRTEWSGPFGGWGWMLLLAWFTVLCFVLRFMAGCCDVPTADPCKAVCEDPAYPVPCLVGIEAVDGEWRSK